LSSRTGARQRAGRRFPRNRAQVVEGVGRLSMMSSTITTWRPRWRGSCPESGALRRSSGAHFQYDETAMKSSCTSSAPPAFRATARRVGGHEHRLLENSDEDERAVGIVDRDLGGHAPDRSSSSAAVMRIRSMPGRERLLHACRLHRRRPHAPPSRLKEPPVPLKRSRRRTRRGRRSSTCRNPMSRVPPPARSRWANSPPLVCRPMPSASSATIAAPARATARSSCGKSSRRRASDARSALRR